jgi:hypothetical protein
MTLLEPLALDIDDTLLYDLLCQLFQETAQEMSDSESDSIDVASLQLISEIVFLPHVSDEPLRALRNRIQSVALLDLDLIPERRRFVHSEVHAYFLAQAYIQGLGAPEIDMPRSIRRNIVGSELLEVFHDVAQNTAVEQFSRFMGNAVELLRKRRYDDRSTGNIASLILASLGSFDGNKSPVIEDVVVDEGLIRGTATPAILKRASISKLDLRGADASDVAFVDCHIGTLVVDAGSRLPGSLPLPAMLQVVNDNGLDSIYNPSEIQNWMACQNQSFLPSGADAQVDRPIDKLLDKLCRTMLRQSWIRDAEDDRSGRLLRDVNWPPLREVLQKHELLDERTDIPAGGGRSQFVRIRRAREILSPTFRDKKIAAFLNDL